MSAISRQDYLLLHGQISEVKTEVTSDKPQEILLADRDSVISSVFQPTNGTVYIATYLVESITLPLSENFKNHGFRIVIVSLSSNITINMASDNSTDIVIYNGEAIVSPDNFSITNKGYVEMVWISSGWVVLNSYGLTVNSGR